MHIFSGGSKLQIARSQLSDSGTYTCVAFNVEGKAHKSYRLTVQGTSTFSNPALCKNTNFFLEE